MKNPFLVLALFIAVFVMNINAAEIKWALKRLPQNSLFNGFHDGIAICYDTITKKYGAVDTNGELVIPISYDYLSDFNGDVAIARTEKGEGLVDENNQFVLEPNSAWKISSIVTDNENASQMLRNSFLVVNESEQTQAIFYKNKFITDFTLVHSIAYDVHFPFITIDMGKLVNTKTEELVSSIVDMGSYYLTENIETGEICAISRFTGENITAAVIGEYISLEQTKNFIGQSFYESNSQTIEKSVQDVIDKYYCSLSHKNGIWKMALKNGEEKFVLKDEDGWICKTPLYQDLIVWFERKIPNTDSTQIKIVNVGGVEMSDKTILGSYKIKLFPAYLMGMKCYTMPYICFTEISPEGIEKSTTIECIIRGKTVEEKSKAVDKRDYASYTFNGGNYIVCGNYLLHQNADNETIIYDIEKDITVQAKKIIDYSEDMILAINTNGQYFTIRTGGGQTTTLSDFKWVNAYNENVAVAANANGKVIIDVKGNILAEEGKKISFIGDQISEDVIVALDKKSNRMGFMYSPLIKDTLIYNTNKKVEFLLAKGNECFEKKKYNKAEKYFNSIINHDPNNVEVIIKIGDCSLAQGYYDSAIHHYSKALRVAPSNNEAANRLAKAQRRKEQAELAAERTRAICSAIYEGLSNVNEALSSIQTQSTSAPSVSTSKGNANAAVKESNRNDSNYRFSLMQTYSDYENQLSKMNTYPETYNDSNRKYIQSRMKSIRAELERRGYTQRKSEWEDWDGRKR